MAVISKGQAITLSASFVEDSSYNFRIVVTDTGWKQSWNRNSCAYLFCFDGLQSWWQRNGDWENCRK